MPGRWARWTRRLPSFALQNTGLHSGSVQPRYAAIGCQDWQGAPVEPSEAARNRSMSVRRALGLLLFVGEHDEQRGVSLKDIATGLELNKSTALRLFEPLIDFGLVTQD